MISQAFWNSKSRAKHLVWTSHFSSRCKIRSSNHHFYNKHLCDDVICCPTSHNILSTHSVSRSGFLYQNKLVRGKQSNERSYLTIFFKDQRNPTKVASKLWNFPTCIFKKPSNWLQIVGTNMTWWCWFLKNLFCKLFNL